MQIYFWAHDEKTSMPQFLNGWQHTINKRLLLVLKDIEYKYQKTTEKFSFSRKKFSHCTWAGVMLKQQQKTFDVGRRQKSHKNLANFVQNNCFVLISLWWGGLRRLTFFLNFDTMWWTSHYVQDFVHNMSKGQSPFSKPLVYIFVNFDFWIIGKLIFNSLTLNSNMNRVVLRIQVSI